MPCYRPTYPTTYHVPSRRPRDRPRSPFRHPSLSLLPIQLGPTSPWSFDPDTGDVLLREEKSGNTRALTPLKRNLSVLATRYPERYSEGGSCWQAFDKEDHELLLLVRKHPLDLTQVIHSPGSRLRPAQTNSRHKAPLVSIPTADEMASTYEPQPSPTTPDAPALTSTTFKPTKKSLPLVPKDSNTWTYDIETCDIFVVDEPLTGIERIIVLLVSRYPKNFRTANSFVRAGEKSLTSWEHELVEAARKFPCDFNLFPQHRYPNSDNTPSRHESQSSPQLLPHQPPPAASRKSLPKRPPNRLPWTTDVRHKDIYASGELLNNFEHKLVLLASRYPGHFQDPGEFKARGEPKLTGWERELVLAAKKFPVHRAEVEEANSSEDNMAKNRK